MFDVKKKIGEKNESEKVHILDKNSNKNEREREKNKKNSTDKEAGKKRK